MWQAVHAAPTSLNAANAASGFGVAADTASSTAVTFATASLLILIASSFLFVTQKFSASMSACLTWATAVLASANDPDLMALTVAALAALIRFIAPSSSAGSVAF